MVVVSLSAITYLTDETSDEIDGRARRAGAPDVDAVGVVPPGVGSGDPPGSGGGDPLAYQGEVRASNVDLCWDGLSTQRWKAQMTLTVAQQSPTGASVQGAEVRVRVELAMGKNDDPPSAWTWGPDADGDIVALSDATGHVSITRTDLARNGNPQVHSVRYTVVSITGEGLSYSPTTPLVREVTRENTGGIVECP